MTKLTKEQLIEDLKASKQNASGMFEISEDTICALMSMLAATPAPVSVPDEVMAAMQKVARIRLDLNDFDGDKRGILDCLGDAEEELIEVVNLRAAMLQGAEPVTTAYKLPPHIFRELVNRLRDTAVKYQGCQQLREQLIRTLQEVIQPAAPQQEVK